MQGEGPARRFGGVGLGEVLREVRGGGCGFPAVDGGGVRSARHGAAGAGTAVIVENWVGLGLAVLLVGYLLLALLFPDRF